MSAWSHRLKYRLPFAIEGNDKADNTFRTIHMTEHVIQITCDKKDQCIDV